LTEYHGLIQTQGRQDAPIVFTSADPSPSTGDWAGLNLQSGVPRSIEHIIVEYGTNGVSLGKRDFLTACGDGAAISVGSSEFRYNDAWGFSSQMYAHEDTLCFEDCRFTNNGVGGVRMQYGFAEIRDCDFLKNDTVSTDGSSVYGIYLGGTGPLGASCFEGCTIERNFLDAGTGMDPDTSYWDYGIYISDGDGDGSITVSHNYINSFLQGGIWIGSLQSPARVDTNCVKSGIQGYSGFGLKFTGTGSDSALVRNNIVFQNTYGVMATSNPFPILGDESDTTLFWGGNHLVDNTYYVRSDSSRTLMAERCWWGSTPVDSLFLGVVDYIPYLGTEPTGVDDESPQAYVYALGQSYPNPVTGGQTKIRFTVAKKCEARLVVYDVLGRHVAVLFSGTAEPGWHDICWDTRNDTGSTVSPGMYFYRLETPAYRVTKKAVVLK
jgi:hypothetical protein